MSNTPSTIYLKDYSAPAYLVDSVTLDIALHTGFARVSSRLTMRRNPAGAVAALVLNGEELTLETLILNGRTLTASDFVYADDLLTIHQVPESFVLETVVRIEPERVDRHHRS